MATTQPSPATADRGPRDVLAIVSDIVQQSPEHRARLARKLHQLARAATAVADVISPNDPTSSTENPR